MEITQSPTPVIKKPTDRLPKSMKLGDALSETARGEKITKKEWDDKEVYGYLVNAELRLHRGGKDHVWVISEGDIIGDDWMIV